MKRLVWKLWVALTLLALVGCGPATVIADEVRSNVEREASPAVSETDRVALVEGNSAFAFDLYQALAEGGPDNLFYSPYSISIALAMTYAGARGETARQMAETMHYSLAAQGAQEDLHPAFNGLDQILAARGQGAAGVEEGKGFQLNIANALWGQRGYQFLQPFLDTLARNYGAGLRLVDFQEDAEGARVTINDWIAEQTKDRIQNLIPPGAIDSLTRLVLTNAIYFNAAWQTAFDEEQTVDGPFTRVDGRQVTVPMMRIAESFAYAAGEGYQAVELPYDGGELSMVIMMPAEGAFEAFEGTLDTAQVSDIVERLSHKRVALTMPRFEFESEFNLSGTLQAMGMDQAFSAAGDFSGMTGNRELAISDVIHKAFVAVDESGTEAAAATAVIMRLTAAPAEPVEMTVDRPFIFLIRDIETDTVLFLGRVMDPSA